jgi:hypothetical protein
MATDTSDPDEDVRVVIKRFHDLVFSEPDTARKLNWIHARVRDTSRPVAPLQAVIDEWERELDHARRTDFAEMAAIRGCAVEEIIEDERPKPSVRWRPLLVPDGRSYDVSDSVFLLAVLHDSMGRYRRSPMKPPLTAKGDDFTVGFRWATAMDGLPRPEDGNRDWKLPSWFKKDDRQEIDGWFKQFQEAFTREFGGAERPAEGGGATGETHSKQTKAKRSTENGEGDAKLIPALTKHHKYAKDSVLNLDPIGNNELARLAGVSVSTASAFFKKQFGGHPEYKRKCKDVNRLIPALKMLNQEYSPLIFFGDKPPDDL